MKKLAYHDFDLVFLINIDAGRLLVVEGGGVHNKGKKDKKRPEIVFTISPIPPISDH